jgi:beta-phosphoglucomutase
MLRAVVFDFDGVIANSEPLHYKAFRDVLDEQGIAFSEAEYYKEYLGFDDLNVFRQLAADRGLAWDAGRLDALVATKAVRMEDLEKDGSILFPGATAAVRRTSAALPIAIASGALRAEIGRILDREQLTSCFRFVVGAEDTPVSKPAPDPYLRAVALLAQSIDRLLASQCVAVEDSPWGLQSARTAGLRTVAVAHTYSRATLDADLIIDSLDELDIGVMQHLCAD